MSAALTRAHKHPFSWKGTIKGLAQIWAVPISVPRLWTIGEAVSMRGAGILLPKFPRALSGSCGAG